MKVRVNKDACIGCGLCASLCEAFGIGDDGLAEVVNEAAAAEDAVNDAAASCPVGAIEVE